MSTDLAGSKATATHLTASNRSLLLMWAVTRIGVILVAIVANWTVLTGNLSLGAYASLWDHFESLWYADIASNGYVGEGQFQYNTAYFPGTALVMRGGLLLGIQPAVTALVVALIASAAASLALAKIAEARGVSSRWTVLAWLIAPTTVFMVAPWSEAPFAGFAFWAWAQAVRGRWWLAGVLAGCASLFRISGVFLGLGLVAMWWLSEKRPWRSLLPLALPFATVAGYFLYLWFITGRITAWRDAHRDFWGRETVDPVSAFVNSWELIFTFDPGRISSRFIAEIAAVILIAIGLIFLAQRRWWPEFVYVSTTLLALITSTFYYSVPRTVTLLFPLWLLLGAWIARSRMLRVAYLVLVIPFTTLVVIRFTDGQWIS